MTSFLTTFQNSATNFHQKQIEDNIKNLLAITQACGEGFDQKFRLAQAVLAGVRQRDGNYESLEVKPVPELKFFSGDTAYGTLMKMVEQKKTLLQHPDEGGADKEQSGDDSVYVNKDKSEDDGRDVDEEEGEDSGEGST